MSLDLTTLVRLEVQNNPTGLANLCANPTGERGAWGWQTFVGACVADGVNIGGGAWRLTLGTRSDFMYPILHTEVPVTPGKYIAASFLFDSITGSGVTGTEHVDVSFNFYNGAGENLPGGNRSPLWPVSATRRNTTPVLVPAGVETAVVVWVGYGNSAGTIRPAQNITFYFGELVIAEAATAGEVSALAWGAAPNWTNILGKANTITTTREPLSVGTLTADILNPDLDPTVDPNVLLRPGRPIRVTALTPGGAWEPLFTGTIDSPTATTTLTPQGTLKRRIRVTASDATKVLANTSRPTSWPITEQMPNSLEGIAVPWNINGQTGHTSTPIWDEGTTGPTDEGASALDQIVQTRDGNAVYGWVDRTGVLRVVNRGTNIYDPAEPASYDDALLTLGALDYGFDPADLVNEVVLTEKHRNTDTGTDTEATYTRRHVASQRAWGKQSRAWTYPTTSKSDATPAPGWSPDAMAAAVFAAHATPQPRPRRIGFAIDQPAKVTDKLALLDLYRRMRVTLPAQGIDYTARATQISHNLTITPERHAWAITVDLDPDGHVPAATRGA